MWAESWRSLPLLLGLVLRRPQLQLQMGFDQDEHGIHFPKLCNSFVLAGVRLVIIPGWVSMCLLLHIRLCLSKERGRGLLTCCWLVRPKAMLTHTCWQSPAQLWHLPNAAGSTNHFITAGVCMAAPGYSCGQACTSLLWATIYTHTHKINTMSYLLSSGFMRWILLRSPWWKPVIRVCK